RGGEGVPTRGAGGRCGGERRAPPGDGRGPRLRRRTLSPHATVVHGQRRNDRARGALPPRTWRARGAGSHRASGPAVPGSGFCGAEEGARRMILLHVSDLHFGPPYSPEAGEALLAAAHELRPDVIVA